MLELLEKYGYTPDEEQIGKLSDFVWPELLRQTKWNMDNSIGLDRYSWDMEDEPDEDDLDEDDAYES